MTITDARKAAGTQFLTSSTRFIALFLLVASFYGCGNSDPWPSDDRVIADMDINSDGLISAHCTKGKHGEKYWHAGDQTWYWDRGVVVKRKANISGAPDAVVTVRGLVRYHVQGELFSYYKFLTTDNSYEGIPAPSNDEITDYVESSLQKVFMGKAHSITEVSSISLTDDEWTWHNATSFTATFEIIYKEKVSYTDVALRKGLFDIRFYKDQISAPIANLLATESSRHDLETTKYTQDQVNQMKSILDI